MAVDGELRGVGHNQRVQLGSVTRHGETDCLENIGRLPASVYRRATLYTTLSPCAMCTGTILLYGIGRVVMAHGKDLRWIQFWTAGIERGIRFGMPRGIPVSTAPGVKGPTVAEHAMLLMLASFRRFREIEQARVERTWIRDQMHATSRTLEEATLVIVGFGSIGQEMMREFIAEHPSLWNEDIGED